MKFSREINHIFDTFCRTWKSDAKAKLNLSAENPIVKAALELDLRKLDEAPPGVSAATGGHLWGGRLDVFDIIADPGPRQGLV